jgi:hypothetical protein
MVACAICLAGVGLSGSTHGEWLSGPAIVFFLMGVYQLGNGGQDDPVRFSPPADPETKRRPDPP